MAKKLPVNHLPGICTIKIPLYAKMIKKMLHETNTSKLPLKEFNIKRNHQPFLGKKPNA
jgi:hypothetical protein